MDSGHVRDNLNEKWHNISTALRLGLRGLEGGSSLAKLLAKERSVRNVRELPPLSEAQILKWADAHYARNGTWPNESSVAVVGAPRGEKWANVNAALSQGLRGLPGGSSLAVLIAAERGVRNRASVPPLTIKQILRWADAHHKRTGAWPACKDGPIDGVPDETWDAIDAALRQGVRGLPGGSSLTQLLAEHRGARNMAALPRLTKKQILLWADAHHARTGQWPQIESGAVLDAPGETWSAINNALYSGFRGLPGGSSLPQLLAKARKVRNRADPPRLTEAQILRWAEAHRQRTGKWPGQKSGPVDGAPGETWKNLNQALRNGHRGLPGGSSLVQLLGKSGRGRAVH
jgi:hypothetical protein